MHRIIPEILIEPGQDSLRFCAFGNHTITDIVSNVYIYKYMGLTKHNN